MMVLFTQAKKKELEFTLTDQDTGMKETIKTI